MKKIIIALVLLGAILYIFIKTTDKVSTQPPAPAPVVVTPIDDTTPPIKVPVVEGKITTSLNKPGTSENITITPTEVTEDSRCPANVQCVWAGTVKLKAKVNIGQKEQLVAFTLGQTQEVGEYKIAFTEVSPEKTDPLTSKISYQFTFVITDRVPQRM